MWRIWLQSGREKGVVSGLIGTYGCREGLCGADWSAASLGGRCEVYELSDAPHERRIEKFLGRKRSYTEACRVACALGNRHAAGMRWCFVKCGVVLHKGVEVIPARKIRAGKAVAGEHAARHVASQAAVAIHVHRVFRVELFYAAAQLVEGDVDRAFDMASRDSPSVRTSRSWALSCCRRATSFQ